MQFLFSRSGNHAKLYSRMTDSKKTRDESIDAALRNRAQRLKQRVLREQHHLEEIGREVNAIKMIARKHAKRHR
jgi:hypothetical protein